MTFKSLILLSIYIITFSGLSTLHAQGIIKGVIIDNKSRQPLPYVNIILEGSATGTTSDSTGKFELNCPTAGFVKLVVSSIGYKTKVTEDIFVTRDKTPFIEIELETSVANLKEVEIKGPQFVKKDESPVSLQTLGIREIERNPGGNRDISKVIQSLPGVASSPSFRNDIIIRGGAPSENKFYLDEIEIPVINHFQTQGSTGGPVGIINVNFIREVDFYSGSFPASRGNALSSVMEFKQIEGNQQKTGVRFALGSSEAGLTADGPITPKTNYIFSVRRSYLKFLFSIFKLPFLPTFTDVQFKVKHRINSKNEITLIGLGGYDLFELNTSVNDDVSDPEQLELNNYILGNIPINRQWNYTTGINYKHYGTNNTSTFIFSRNELSNLADKYFNNDDSKNENHLLDYNSSEAENKFRFEKKYQLQPVTLSFGLNTDYVTYRLSGFDTRSGSVGPVRVEFASSSSFLKYGGFVSASKRFFRNRFIIATGIRTDANTYSSIMNQPLKQLSPRLSASYLMNEKWSANFNTGRYFQLPAYTILGFGDENGNLVNKRNNVTWLQADHLVGGIQFEPDLSSKITIEGFYKKYRNYPFSVNDSVSLANQGSDFGVIGNEEIVSTSVGRAYGAELLMQRRASTGIYGILALTLVRSEFKNDPEQFKPSAWDNRFILTFTGGKTFAGNWETGLRWRFVGGRPYTPYNLEASALKSNWDASGMGVPDYTKLNSKRLPAFHQLDIRIDKSIYFRKWSVNLYLDIQNVYNFKSKSPDIFNVQTDASNMPVSDPENDKAYLYYFIKDETGTILPTIGIILDF